MKRPTRFAEDLAAAIEVHRRKARQKAEKEQDRREEPDLEMYPGGAAYNDVMGYNDHGDY